MSQKEVASTLARNAVFAVLSPQRRRELTEGGTPVELAKGQKLFGRGDRPDAAYAIITGEVEVTIEGPDGRSVFIARLGSGTVVGEMGVLDGVVRATEVRATRKTELWRIAREHVIAAL